MSKRVLISMLLAILLSTTAIPAHSGVGDIPISGTVRDRAGGPLGGVRISDGSKWSLSDSQGRYSIDQPAASGYVLTASKEGLVSQTFAGTALPGTTVDFSMYYQLVTSLSPAAFKNSPPATLNISVTSHAPTDACVSWTDARTAAVTSLSVVNPVAGASNLWTGEFNVDSGVPDGTYSSSAVAKRCADGLELTKPFAKSYVIDSLAPEFTMIAPLDHGNTIFPSAPILTASLEAGSGLDSGSLRATIQALPAGDVQQLSVQMTGNVVKSSGAALQLGVDYKFDLVGRDWAGNEGSISAEFRAISPPQLGEAISTLAADGENTGEAGTIPGYTKWKFKPALFLGNRSVVFHQGSRHPGLGTITTVVPVDQAKVTIHVLGSPQIWPTKPYPEGAKREAMQQLPYTRSAGSAVEEIIAGQSFDLPEISIELPAGTESASIEMPEVTTSAVVNGLCLEPASASGNCSRDPLRFFLPERLAERFDVELTDARAASGDPSDCVTDIYCYLYTTQVFISNLVNEGLDANWRTLTPIRDSCTETVPYGYTCSPTSVVYPSTSAVIPPIAFGTTCASTGFCAYASSAKELRRKYACISSSTGKDLWARTEGRCYQYWALSWAAYPSSNHHVFYATWEADWGFEDDGNDLVGLHWSTQKRDMRWTEAPASEVQYYTSTGNPYFASYGADPDSGGGVYPQSTATGHPENHAYRSWETCFTARTTITGGRRFRSGTDTQNRTAYAYGVATGLEGNPAAGWPQHQHIDCTQETNQRTYFRTHYGRATAIVAQVDRVGRTTYNGALLATFGHRIKVKTTDLTKWVFAPSGPSCGVPPPSCSIVGIGFSPETYDKTYNSYYGYRVYNAFSYK